MLKKLSKMLGVALTLVLLASLLTVAAPAAALGAPEVTFPTTADANISKANAGYIIRFESGKQLTGNATLGNNSDTITITFPTGYTIAPAVTATITAGPGWMDKTGGAGETWQNAVIIAGGANWTSNPAARTITYTLNPANEYIGEGSEVRIAITAGVTNPADIADYQLTVKTSKETTAVASNSYSITAPYVQALPGIVEVYNPSGVKMDSQTGNGAIQAMVTAATIPGSVVKIGAGTYNEAVAVAVGGITIMNADGVDTSSVIINGSITVNAASASKVYPNTTIEGLTIHAANGGNAFVTAGTADKTVLKNCVITKASVPATAVKAEVLVLSGSGNLTISGNSFDTTDGAVADTAIQLGAPGPAATVTVDGNTFTLDATTAAVNDLGVDVLAAQTVNIKNNTFTGSSGVAYQTAAACVSKVAITGNTFTGLTKAIYEKNGAIGATLSIKENTITASTVSPVATAATATAAVDLENVHTASIEKNTISDNGGYAIIVGAAANATGISIIGNTLSGNTYGTVNKNVGATLVAELNYWGNNSGPTIAANPGGVGDPVVAAVPATYGAIDYMPWSNTSTSEVVASQAVAADGTVDKSTTVGIAYSSTAATAGISLMKYSANPAPVDTKAPALEGGYYDVYSPNAGGTNTIMFFNSAINADTKAYYYSNLKKAWTICSDQSVSGNGAYVYITVGAATSPSNNELGGTIFALVDEKSIPTAPAINTPKVGETNVSIEPMFTWTAVQNAVRYEISVADDPSFTFLTLSHNVEGITFYKADADNEEALDYDTTYYWRVRAVLEDSYAATTPATPYQVGIFTTMAEPTEAADNVPTITVEPTKPEVNVEIPPTKITVEPAPAAIPTYILWIIVVVGAVLIIALIVLIVRTRRVA